MLIQLSNTLHRFVWGPGMLLFFTGCGVYLSCGTRFFQLTHLGLWLRATLGSLFPQRRSTHSAPASVSESKKKQGDAHGISQFQTFTTALAGTLGTGNIVGVATALTAGGPGAIFWMWISALIGMMTGFSENVLGMLYRRKNENGAWVGGPMEYLERGLHAKWLAVLFAVFTVLASFGMGNMAQANSLAGAVESGFGVPPWLAGVVAAAAIALVVTGGIRRIGKVTEKLIPIMTLLYIAGCTAILVRFSGTVPAALAAIFRDAFVPRSALGGAAGYGVLQAMRFGTARGVFSNEAGLGSSVIIHAAAAEAEPVQQGMWSICEIFIDTIVMCTLTALCLLATGASTGGADGAAMAVDAFRIGLGESGGIFLSIAVVLFAFSTLLGWSYYGERAIAYLFGERSLPWYRILFVALIPIGCVTQLGLVWEISDTCNGLMAVPNLIGVVALSGLVFRETRQYLARRPLGSGLALHK